MLLCVLLLTLLISLPKVDCPSFLNLKEHTIIPSLTFQTVSQQSSINIEDISLSTIGRAFFFLSKTPKDYYSTTSLQNGSSIDNSIAGKILDVYNMNESVAFTELEGNTKYYLYSFAEAYENQAQSQVHIQEITTSAKANPMHLKEYVTEQISTTLSIFSLYYEVFISALPSIVLVLIMCIIFKNLENVSDPFLNTKAFEVYNKKLEGLTHFTSLNAKDHYETPSCTHSRFNDITLISDLIAQNKEIIRRNTSPNDSGLEEAIDVLEQQNQDYRDQRLCGVCCERPREIVFLNCGHLYCCMSCSMKLPFCPLDQQLITAKVKYRSYNQNEIVGQATPTLMAKTPESTPSFYTPFHTLMKSMRSQLSPSERLMLLKAQNENYRYIHNCIVCGVKPKDSLFFGCCHILCCSDCATNMEICPFDRKHIISKLKVYIP